MEQRRKRILADFTSIWGGCTLIFCLAACNGRASVQLPDTYDALMMHVQHDGPDLIAALQDNDPAMGSRQSLTWHVMTSFDAATYFIEARFLRAQLLYGHAVVLKL